MQQGANGFLLKDEDPEVVIQAVRRVAQDGVYFRDYVSQALLKSNRARNGQGGTRTMLKARLSDRELEVLTLICQEYTSKEIADQLFISLHTVKTHARKINVKLGAKSRTQALHRAKELLLI